MMTLDQAVARVTRERRFLSVLPRADRAILEGIPHVRLNRDGEWSLVPIFRVEDAEITALIGRPVAEMAVHA